MIYHLAKGGTNKCSLKECMKVFILSITFDIIRLDSQEYSFFPFPGSNSELVFIFVHTLFFNFSYDRYIS